MKIPLLLSLSALSLSMFTGCAADSSDADESTVESEVVGSQTNFGYFVVTRREGDGFWVKRVNNATTTCADGSKAAECFMTAVTYAGADLSDREEADASESFESSHGVVKARVYKKTVNGKIVGTLKATEVWVGVTGSNAADAGFYRVADNGIRCITAPCPSTTAFTLNTNDQTNIVNLGLDNTETPATQEQLDAAHAAVATTDGLLVAGGLALPKCVAGANCGPFVNASELYLRVVHSEGNTCGGRGGNSCSADQYCSWEAKDICGAFDSPGHCAYKPDFCPQYVNPVCACDGQTYGNSCFAAQAGTSVSSQGACATAN